MMLHALRGGRILLQDRIAFGIASHPQEFESGPVPKPQRHTAPAPRLPPDAFGSAYVLKWYPISSFDAGN